MIISFVLVPKGHPDPGVCVCTLSRVLLFVTPLAVALQASLSMDFSMQEYWSGLPFPTTGDISNPVMDTTLPALTSRFFTSTTWEASPGVAVSNPKSY